MATRRAFLKTAAFGTAYLFSSRARAADLTSTIQARINDYCARTLADSGANVAIALGLVAPKIGGGVGQLIFAGGFTLTHPFGGRPPPDQRTPLRLGAG